MYTTLKRYLITTLSGYRDFKGIPQADRLVCQNSLKREIPYFPTFSITNALAETTIKIDNQDR